ncbi:MAG: hypothetical protein AAGA21_23220 [Pseudomonadota bacterium]
MTIQAIDADGHSVGRPIWSAPFAMLESLRRWYRQRRDLKEARDAFIHMAYLDDRILDDIGATREEVQWALSLPLERNAALALRARAAKRCISRSA